MLVVVGWQTSFAWVFVWEPYITNCIRDRSLRVRRCGRNASGANKRETRRWPNDKPSSAPKEARRECKCRKLIRTRLRNQFQALLLTQQWKLRSEQETKLQAPISWNCSMLDATPNNFVSLKIVFDKPKGWGISIAQAYDVFLDYLFGFWVSQVSMYVCGFLWVVCMLHYRHVSLWRDMHSNFTLSFNFAIA